MRAVAPATPQEMLDLTMDAFRMAFEYRAPVVVLPDGYLGLYCIVLAIPCFVTSLFFLMTKVKETKGASVDQAVKQE